MLEKIIIADHHGFCMGVKRAIDIAEQSSTQKLGEVTILKEIVHNDAVVKRFRDAGIKQEFNVDDISSGDVIVSAHGIDPKVIDTAREKGLNVIDATCPLVTRIHDIIDKLMERDYHVIHFGDYHHDETMGVVGHATDGRITVIPDVEALKSHRETLGSSPPKKLALTSQTTAGASSFAEAEKLAMEYWPHIKIFNTICNATSQRQSAILKLAPSVDMTLVVGSRTSANSLRLAEIADVLCDTGILIEDAGGIKEEWFSESAENPVRIVGISAGASTPEFLVEGVVEKLLELSNGQAEVIRPKKRARKNTLALQEEPLTRPS